MTVDTKHPLYDKNLDRWEYCRDFYQGEDDVKAKGVKYLPMLKKQEMADYDRYKSRAVVYGAYSRTVDGMTGLAFRKDPNVVLPESAAEFVKDVSLRNQDLKDFARQCVRNTLIFNRGGFLVDMPAEPEERDDRGNVVSLTRARREELNLDRPRWIWYEADSITSWYEEVRDNEYRLVRVNLHECRYEPNDQNEMREIHSYRVCELDENGQYIQRVFQEVTSDPPETTNVIEQQHRKSKVVQDEQDRRTSRDKAYEEVEVVRPTMGGQPLTFIPWFQVCSQDIGMNVAKPLLMDLVWLNRKHYQLGADYYHGLFYTSIPTPWASGTNKEETPAAIGPDTVWVASDPQARFGMLEFSGAGLAANKEELASLEHKMAALGARLLAPDDLIDATATATNVRVMGETSVLAAVSDSVSQTITQALRLTVQWAAAGEEPADDDVKFELNKEFMPLPLTGPELTAQVGAYQSGSMSFETFYRNLQRGNLADPEVDADEEKNRIDDGSLSLGPKARQDKADERFDEGLGADEGGGNEGEAA